MSPRKCSAVLAALPLLATLVLPGAARAEDDPNLEQRLGDQAIVHGERVLDVGHVDMGPKYDDGQWRLLVHDDVAKADAAATSVWRYPDETVLHVLDHGKRAQPDDPAYAFTGAAPGDPVWIVPQTQDPKVLWLGWNTQDPEVMTTIDRGITLSMTGVEGPGVVTVYLQPGTFGAPQLLWESRRSDPQPVWVGVNTHTHANWVFTQPGVYLVRLQIDADLRDGTHRSDTRIVRFAVGSATSPADALAATWQGPTRTAPASPAAAAPAAEGTDGPLVPILVGAIVVVALTMIVGFTLALVRGGRARRAVLTSGADSQRST